MTDHELNIEAAKAMGWQEDKSIIYSESTDPEIDHTFQREENTLKYTNRFGWPYDAGPARKFWYVSISGIVDGVLRCDIWNPIQDLNQAWELYSHYFPVEVDNLYSLAWNEDSKSWRSSGELARAIVESVIWNVELDEAEKTPAFQSTICKALKFQRKIT